MNYSVPLKNHAKKDEDSVSFWMLSPGASDSTLLFLQGIGVRNGKEIAGGILLLSVPAMHDTSLEKLKDSALARQPDFEGRSKFQAMKL